MSDIDLNKFSFFKNMKTEHLKFLSLHMTQDTFKVNEYIVKENEQSLNLFLILKGKVSIEMLSPEGKPFSIQTLTTGDIVGMVLDDPSLSVSILRTGPGSNRNAGHQRRSRQEEKRKGP